MVINFIQLCKQNIDKIVVLFRSPPPSTAPIMSPVAKAGIIDRRSISMATTDTEVGYIVNKMAIRLCLTFVMLSSFNHLFVISRKHIS